MKRVLLIFFIVLSLFVSCSSTQVKKPEPQVEQPTTEAVSDEQAVNQKETDTASETVEEPVEEEEAPAQEVEPVSSEEVEQPVAEQEVTETEPTESELTEATVAEDNPVDEQDWSQVIGAAPTETVEEETAETEVAAEAPASVETKETTVQNTEVSQSPARVSKPSFVDRLTSFARKIGDFIASQILLSIGIFVCFGGFVYLIVALVTSSRREKRRSGYCGKKTKQDRSESDTFRPEQDKDPETDDDFLRSLLGDDND